MKELTTSQEDLILAREDEFADDILKEIEGGKEDENRRNNRR